MSDIITNQVNPKGRLPVVAIMVSTLLLTFIMVAETAYQVTRSIGNGQINQTYLWAEEIPHPNDPNDVLTHRGVDFVATTGTNVYAVADGTVVDLNESLGDDDHSTSFGNFVLIRHNASQRHWDQTNLPNGALSFTYSMYLHLSHDSVVPNVNDQVSVGDLIAQSGNTGISTGPHLHFQIVLHPASDVGLDPDTLGSGVRSRNPELWLSPLNGRGTAVGKVSDSNGNPIGNLVVCGIKKNAPTTGYVSSRTYSFSWANPDDISRENFGTTDVQIGTYSLYNNSLAQGCNGGTHLGSYTFAANNATTLPRPGLIKMAT